MQATIRACLIICGGRYSSGQSLFRVFQWMGFLMYTPMQPFIAEAIRMITNNLETTSQDAAESILAIPRSYEILDSSMGDVIGGRSVVFPDVTNDIEPSWCVLTADPCSASRNTHEFGLRGRLESGLPAQEFVERAYRLILSRELDDEGRNIYPPLIESQHLTKREVLKILVSSPEAQSLGTYCLIVPEPSAWLTNLGIDPDADVSFPPLHVKIIG
jgi:hypothetical protein